MIDSLILDVDGTLWDSTPIVAGAWSRAAHECGFPDYEVTADLLRQLFGRTMEVIAQHMFPEETKEKRTEIMDLCCIYEHEALVQDECRICFPGVIETIRTISRSMPVFIVSNCQSGYIELFLEKTGLGDCVTDIECYGNTGKNKGENIRLLAERNHLEHPVYLGDTQGDADASKEAGVQFVFASYGFGHPEQFDASIAKFDELPALLQKL
jgi:phosphoglycolate phosphatase